MKMGVWAIIFIPGGHGAGYGFYNYHKIFRTETRSILFDRPATGWSDVGPFPRTSYREAVFGLSDKVQTYSIPEGNTHNFPYEIPDYVAALVRDMLHRIEDPAAQPTLGANLPHGWRGDTQYVSELTAKSAEAAK